MICLITVSMDYKKILMRILCRLLKLHHITDVLVSCRHLNEVLIPTYMYQAYYKTAPQYLCDLIIPYSNAGELRSNTKLVKPCQKCMCRYWTLIKIIILIIIVLYY